MTENEQEFDPTPENLRDVWERNPTTENMSRVASSLDPSVNYALSRLGDGGRDPVVRAKAWALVPEAVRTYDPARGTKLSTHVVNQLQQLGRFSRERSSVARLPDRTQLDSLSIERARQAFAEENDHEPSVAEIADMTALTPKRIAKLQRAAVAVPSESAQLGELEGSSSDFMQDALSYLWDEGDTVDRLVIEHRLGFGGSNSMDVRTLAKRARTSPSDISRRANDLLTRAQQMERILAS